jgi:hypothetical protein
MTWRKLKRNLDELQGVIIKILSIIGIFLLLAQALAPRFWDFIAAWRH